MNTQPEFPFTAVTGQSAYRLALKLLVIDPGTYTWQAHSPGGGYYMTDGSGNRSFEFTVAAGEIYARNVGGPPQ